MDDKILLAHGSGGKLSHDLIEKTFVPPFSNPIIDRMDDSAVFDLSHWFSSHGVSFQISLGFRPALIP